MRVSDRGQTASGHIAANVCGEGEGDGEEGGEGDGEGAAVVLRASCAVRARPGTRGLSGSRGARPRRRPRCERRAGLVHIRSGAALHGSARRSAIWRRLRASRGAALLYISSWILRVRPRRRAARGLRRALCWACQTGQRPQSHHRASSPSARCENARRVHSTYLWSRVSTYIRKSRLARRGRGRRSGRRERIGARGRVCGPWRLSTQAQDPVEHSWRHRRVGLRPQAAARREVQSLTARRARGRRLEEVAALRAD